MPNKINVNPDGFPGGSFPWPDFEALYHDVIDSSFPALARDITLHLKPQTILDSSGIQAQQWALNYNPFMGRAPRGTPSVISTVREPGVQHVYRNVVYSAHIKHGPREAADNNGVSLEANEVQTTILIESTNHVNECESATIDGNRYTLQNIRQIGWQNTRYIIAKWSVLNE